MNSDSAAMEAEVAFGFEETADISLFQAPTIQVVPVQAPATIDANSTDIELCRLAATGDLSAFEVIYQRYHRRTSLCPKSSRRGKQRAP